MREGGKFTIVSVATPDYARTWAFCIDSHRAYCAAKGVQYSLFSGLDHPLPRAKLEFLADAMHLGNLRLLERAALIREIRAGIHHLLIEPQAVEVVAEIVVAVDVLSGGLQVVGLLPPPA